MMSTLKQILSSLPPLRRRKNPSLALVIGLAAGGLGLSIYFRSLIDLVVPVAIAIAAALMLGDAGVLGGAIVAGLYGFARAQTSNERQEARTQPAG
jgi:hypothetical protein